MNQTAILYPIAAMMALVFIVACLMLKERIRDLKTLRIRPNDPRVASSSQMSATLKNTRAADNYKNLFEVPVLFYALCLALLFTQAVNSAWLGAAWLYILFRVAHSFLHIAHNRVMIRLAVFLTSLCLLLSMWAVFVWQQAVR